MGVRPPWHLAAASALADEVRARAQAIGLGSLVIQWEMTKPAMATAASHGRILLTSRGKVVWHAEAPIGSVDPPVETWLDARLQKDA